MAGRSRSALKKTAWNKSLDAPHFPFYGAGQPRHSAGDQPAEQQVEFAQFYPNGLPVTYHMVHGLDSGGIAQQYIENHLPVRFYTHPPQHAAGKFSTLYGQRPFRIVGELLPERRVHLWNKDEIQSVCNSLRQVFWADMKRLRRPAVWDDLWEFYDAYDLYNYGALNLWNVMNTLFDENCIIAKGWKADLSIEIGHFCDKWMKTVENQDKLKDWHELKGPVLCVLSQDDWKEIRNLEDDEISLLKSALHHRRDLLLSGAYQNQDQDQGQDQDQHQDQDQDQHPKPAVDLVSAYQAESLENWLAEAQVYGQNGLPPPPASAPYCGSPPMHGSGSGSGSGGKGPGHKAASEGGKAARPSSAVQALQKSVGAAPPTKMGYMSKSGVLVVMGSSKIPPGWEELTADAPASGDASSDQPADDKPATAAGPDEAKGDDASELKAADAQAGKMETDGDSDRKAAALDQGPSAQAMTAQGQKAAASASTAHAPSQHPGADVGADVPPSITAAPTELYRVEHGLPPKPSDTPADGRGDAAAGLASGPKPQPA